MSEVLKIAVAGLGTVGAGTIEVLEANADVITQRAGRSIQIVGVSARDKTAKRAVDISGYQWFDDPTDMVDHCDVMVEMIGGSDGIAHELVQKSLQTGKHVVTANKAMMAMHGGTLAEMAEENNVSLMYEAAVAGGVPAIKAARESFAGNRIRAVFGILNGTSNYIMSQMRESGRSFADVLKDAQGFGYAEADPAFDVGGVDAGHKVALLAAIAFGTVPDFSSVKMTGIENITSDDVGFAADLGYKIKLLGIARDYDGRILQVVEPCLVPAESPFGAIEDVYNAVYFDCDYVETPLLTGLGAGAGATATSVVSDVIDIARGAKVPVFGVPAGALKKAAPMDQREIQGRYFLRLPVLDVTGVVADVSAILRDHDVSIESMLQHGHDPGQAVQIVIVTHKVLHENMMVAIDLIGRLNVVQNDMNVMRIEEDF